MDHRVLSFQDAVDIVTHTFRSQRHQKFTRPDEERLLYADLLEWLTLSMNSISKQTQGAKLTAEESVSEQQRTIIQAMNEVATMFKKECWQKGEIMRIFLEYYCHTLKTLQTAMNRQIESLKQSRSKKIEDIQQRTTEEITVLKEQINRLSTDRDQKWRNMYMLIRDNRVLRRQKGKLLRTLKEESSKLVELNEQIIQISKENERNKLIVLYENDPENLKVYMRNQLSLLHFEKYIKAYPRKARKVLKEELERLENQELLTLNDKVNYIILAIKESEDIYDEYEDLNEEVKLNKLIFNMFSQTDQEDFEQVEEQKVQQPPEAVKLMSEAATETITSASMRIQRVIEISCEPKEKRSCASKQKTRVGFRVNGADQSVKKKKRLQESSMQVNLKILPDWEIHEDTQRTKQHKIARKRQLAIVSSIRVGIWGQAQTTKTARIRMDQKLKPVKMGTAANMGTAGKMETGESKAIATENLKEERKYQGNKINMNELMIATKQSRRQSRTPMPIPGDGSIRLQVNSIDIRVNEDLTGRVRVTSSESSGSTSRRLSDTCYFEKVDQENIHRILSNSQEKEPILESELISRKEKSSESQTHFAFLKKSTMPDNCGNQKRSGSLESQSGDSLKKLIEVVRGPSKVKENRRSIENSSSFRPKEMNKRVSTIVKRSSAFLGVNSMKMGSRILKTEFSTNGETQEQKIRLINETWHRKSMNTGTNDKSLGNKLTVPETNELNRDIEAPSKAISRRQLPNKGEQRLDKQINIFASETGKLMSKLLRSLVQKRKQLQSNTVWLPEYMGSFLKTTYGALTDLKFCHRNQVDKEESTLQLAFSALCNYNAPRCFLEDLFRIYLKMINFQESSLAKDGRINAAEFILAHYLQPKAVEEEIKYHRQRRVDFEDLNSCFVVVESFLRLHSLNTELHVFLVRLLPDCQTKLSYNELKQLMMAFSFDKEYYEHMVRFKEIAQQQIPVHILCLYAKRYRYQNLLALQKALTGKYQALFGVLCEAKVMTEILSAKIERYKQIDWLLYRAKSRLKGMRYDQPPDRTLLLLTRLAMYNSHLARGFPLASNLAFINFEFQKLRVQQEFK